MPAKERSYRSTERTRRGAITAFGSRTDVGCVRDHNEDSLIVAPPLYAVADGMGGHAAGEVASEICVTTLGKLAPKTPDSAELGRAVEQANLDIIDAAAKGHGRQGMGTTCTAAILEGERLVIAQVGDSRAYLMHQGKLQQLTRDHSLVEMMVEAGQLTPEEARVHPRRSVITRALGTDPTTKPDLYEIDVETGDRLLLCSDGLSTMLEDVEIQGIMNRTADPQRCAAQLVNEAIAAGGHDNVTVVVVDVAGKREAQRKKMALKTKLTVAFVLALLAAIVGGACWGINAYVHHTAYLTEDNGDVAVYQGIPEPFLWFDYSEHIETTNIPLDQLSPGVADRIRAGLRVDDVEAAQALVEEYRSQVEGTETNGSSSADDAESPVSTYESEGRDSGAGSSGSSSGSGTGAGSSSAGSNAVTPDDIAKAGA